MIAINTFLKSNYRTCLPNINVCVANVTAFKPDAQTLCIVVHIVDSGKPAKIVACLAGA